MSALLQEAALTATTSTTRESLLQLHPYADGMCRRILVSASRATLNNTDKLSNKPLKQQRSITLQA